MQAVCQSGVHDLPGVREAARHKGHPDRHAAARVLPAELAGTLAALRADNAGTQMAGLPEVWRTRFCLLPYRAVGRPGGLLLAFRPDEIRRVDGKTECQLAAICAEPVAGGRYDGLIGA